LESKRADGMIIFRGSARHGVRRGQFNSVSEPLRYIKCTELRD